MTISVLIPTYRRPQDLYRCLTALETQTRMAEEVLVVVRDTDEETHCFLAEFSHSLRCLRIITVDKPGVIAAMNAGLAQAGGDIVALTDDDAAPHPDWLSRIMDHFAADKQIGGVGGRDWVYFGSRLEDGAHVLVGRVQWFGRVVGFHHMGTGGTRDVDFLKGVNCAYRAEPLREVGFDPRMKGSGAQVHWELALGLAMRRQRWKLIYDPGLGVDHFPSARHDADQRSNMEREVLRDAVHNETLALWSFLPRTWRLPFLTGWVLIGSRIAPGVLFTAHAVLTQKPQAVQIWMETLRGRLLGLKTYYRTRKEF